MSVNALSSNYYNQYQTSNGYTIKNYDPTQWQTTTATTTATTTTTCEDGSDDGKISFGSKVKNFFKGCWNGIKGMVTGAIKHPLKTALTIGACCIPGVGPFIAAGLAGYGIIKGGATIIKNASAAKNATTDAEAEAAWQGIGTGSFQVGMSAVALKGSMNAIGKINKSASEAGTSAIKTDSLLGKNGKIVGSMKNGVSEFRASNMGQALENSSFGKTAKAAKKGFSENQGTSRFTEAYKAAKETVKNETKFGEYYKNSEAAGKFGKYKEAFKETVKNETKFGENYKNSEAAGKFGKYKEAFKETVKNETKFGENYKNSNATTKLGKYVNASYKTAKTDYASVTPALVTATSDTSTNNNETQATTTAATATTAQYDPNLYMTGYYD